MENNDTELIQRTLDGDQTAFTELVEKYQKGIHALAWRKIGDFHIAQEITQDAFLRAYQRLRTLKDYSLFPEWVYVIASHLCTEWHRKKKLPIQSLEATDVVEIDQVSHSHYMTEKRDTEAAETRREVVQKLLQKLPESERTVMALHYLGEMTCEAISKMLGVSPNTIKSRLSRARNRLKKEEAIIRENLSSFQLPSHGESTNQDQSTNIRHQFYIGGPEGIRRSTDGGDSWKQFNAGLGGNIQNLTIFNNKLYAVAGKQLIASTDGGQSWTAIPVESSDIHITFMGKKIPLAKANIHIHIRQITEADGILYAKGYAGFELIFFYLDEENRTLLPIQGVPAFGEKSFTAFMKAIQTSVKDDGKEEEDIMKNSNNYMKNLFSIGTDIWGEFAVSGNTFYVEYKRKLLISHSESQVNNDASWYDTKIEDTRDIVNLSSLKSIKFNSFKLDVSGDTAYVGKSDGILLYSIDKGRNWKTVPLPISVNFFKQILITDETVYVATDKEALSSSDGAKWNIITDLDGQQLLIDRFALDGTTLYAVSSSKNAQGGVYRLTSTDSTWEHITPEIPDNATSIAVANGVLYVGTENSGLQLIGLEDSSHTPLTKAEK